jgi:hypothetical protein
VCERFSDPFALARIFGGRVKNAGPLQENHDPQEEQQNSCDSSPNEGGVNDYVEHPSSPCGPVAEVCLFPKNGDLKQDLGLAFCAGRRFELRLLHERVHHTLFDRLVLLVLDLLLLRDLDPGRLPGSTSGLTPVPKATTPTRRSRCSANRRRRRRESSRPTRLSTSRSPGA